jgi:hypothetical protein
MIDFTGKMKATPTFHRAPITTTEVLQRFVRMPHYPDIDRCTIVLNKRSHLL